METTCDDFLGGRLQIHQPRHGYRAGVDPVLLAASVTAQQGDSVLELGCGVGVASLCLGARIAGVRLCGVEIQPDYADLARQNADISGIGMTVITGDIAARPMPFSDQNFDHVMMNPPYFAQGHYSAAQDPGRAIGRGEQVGLDVWINAALRRLKPRGHLHMIQRVERLPDILTAIQGRLGGISVLSLSARKNRAPHLVIMKGRKGGKGTFRLLHPMVMHQGDTHQDGDHYTPEINAVLRQGAALNDL